MTTPTAEAPAPSWMIVELMGHQRMAGEVTEVTVAGKGFLRIDVPHSDDDPAFTRFVSPDAVYALNPTTEELARRAAAAFRPKVVSEWDLPRQLPPASRSRVRLTCVECGEYYDTDDDGVVCPRCLDASEDEGDGDPVHPDEFGGTDEESHLAAPAAASNPAPADPPFALSSDADFARPRKRCAVRGCFEQLYSDDEERAGLCASHLAEQRARA